MSGNTAIVSSTPGFVVGTYGAKQVRNAALAMYAGRPGLISRGDFAVTQRGAGANMSVDIAAGAAIVYPAQVTRQGPYYVQSDSTYNTSSDGGYSWTAADATNPRIDLVCLEVKDNAEDASGSTGLRFRIVDGTPSASATHQLLTTYWPAVPTGCVPIAAIKIPATDTSISTTDITNLNPIAGPNQAYNYVATAETTTSTTYTRLTNSNGTADFVTVYVPHAYARVRFGVQGHIKTSSVSGPPTAGIALFINDSQMKARSANTPAIIDDTTTGLTTTYSTFGMSSVGRLDLGGTGSSSDVSDVTTGQDAFDTQATATTSTPGRPGEMFGLAAGWKVIELRYKMSSQTLTARERYMWAEVVA